MALGDALSEGGWVACRSGVAAGGRVNALRSGPAGDTPARPPLRPQPRLHTAKLRYPATLEAVDFTHRRQLNRQQVLTHGACAWIAECHNLLPIGPTGIGKSFLSCAFVERACRRSFTARYVRMPPLLHELAVGRGGGS